MRHSRCEELLFFFGKSCLKILFHVSRYVWGRSIAVARKTRPSVGDVASRFISYMLSNNSKNGKSHSVYIPTPFSTAHIILSPCSAVTLTETGGWRLYSFLIHSWLILD
jgi:hypothetical protein